MFRAIMSPKCAFGTKKNERKERPVTRLRAAAQYFLSIFRAMGPRHIVPSTKPSAPLLRNKVVRSKPHSTAVESKPCTYLKWKIVLPERSAENAFEKIEVMSSTSHGQFLKSSPNSSRAFVFCSGGGRTRSFVVANVIKIKTTDTIA